MPSTESIYGHKQPGYGAHPGLKPRKKNAALKKSPSLVLQGGSAGDAGYPEEVYGSLPPIAGAKGWTAALMEEMPVRLENCRQRLLTADRAVSKAVELDLSGTRSEMSEITLLQRQLDEVIKEREKLDGMQAGSATASTYQSDRPATGGEPAPEPPGSAASAVEARDLRSIDQALEEEADTKAQDLKVQLGSVEEKLLSLDKKWRSVEKDRQSAGARERDLADKLTASQERIKILESRLNQSAKVGAASEAHSAKLKKDLGVSEGAMQELRSQISELQNREKILTAQIDSLNARVYTAESECQNLRNNLDSVGQEKEDLAGRLKKAEAALADAEGAHLVSEGERLKAEKGRADEAAARSKAEQAHKEAMEDMERVRSASGGQVEETARKLTEVQQAHAKVVKSHADLSFRHSELQKSHAEKERKLQTMSQSYESMAAELQASGKEKSALPPGGTKQKAKGQILTAAKNGSLEAALTDAKKTEVMAPLGKQHTPFEAAESGELQPTAELLLRMIDPAAGSSQGPRPTQCQVDSLSQELRLLYLRPSGAPRVIPFGDITSVVKNEEDQDKEITIWVKSTRGEKDGDKPQPLKLLPSDNESANMLVAALTCFDRAAPGDLMSTPRTDGIRTPGSTIGESSLNGVDINSTKPVQ